MKLYYFLVNDYEPIIADDIDFLKKLKKTNNVKRISFSQYENILSAYIAYNSIINDILKKK